MGLQCQKVKLRITSLLFAGDAVLLVRPSAGGGAPPSLRPWFSAGRGFLPLGWEKKEDVPLLSDGKVGREVDWWISVVSAVIGCYAEKRAEPEGKAFDLLVNLHSNPHIWSQALSNDQKNETAHTNSSMSFLCSVSGPSLRAGVRSSDVWRTVTAPLCLKEPAEEVPLRMLPGCLPLQVFQAHPTGRRTPSRLGEIIITFGLGSPRDYQEEICGIPDLACCDSDPT